MKRVFFQLCVLCSREILFVTVLIVTGRKRRERVGNCFSILTNLCVTFCANFLCDKKNYKICFAIYDLLQPVDLFCDFFLSSFIFISQMIRRLFIWSLLLQFRGSVAKTFWHQNIRDFICSSHIP